MKAKENKPFNVQLKMLHEDAKIPVYATAGAAGCDIFACEDFTIAPTTVDARVTGSGKDVMLESLTRFFDHEMNNPTTPAILKAKSLTEIIQKAIESTHYEFNLGKATIGSGVAFGIPDGSNVELELRGKSGLAFNHTIDSFNGTVDEDYTLEVSIFLYNLGNEPLHFKKGQKICQGVFKQIIQPHFQVVDEIQQDIVENEARSKNNAVRKVVRKGGKGSTGKY